MALKTGEDGTFWDHLEEFRKRLFVMLAAVGVCAAAAFYFSKYTVSYVVDTAPCELVALAPAEAVTAHVRLSVALGLILASPVVLYQTWRFVAPGLYETEKKRLVAVVSAGAFLFVGGAAFAWFIMKKPALLLFQSFETGNIHGAWSVAAYLGFIGNFLLIFGAAFQLPLVVLFLTRTGIVEPATIAAYRRHVVVGLLVMAAVLTPPDPVTQVMLALPLYVLFEISLIVARISLRKKRNTEGVLEMEGSGDD